MASRIEQYKDIIFPMVMRTTRVFVNGNEVEETKNLPTPLICPIYHLSAAFTIGLGMYCHYCMPSLRGQSDSNVTVDQTLVQQPTSHIEFAQPA